MGDRCESDESEDFGADHFVFALDILFREFLKASVCCE